MAFGFACNLPENTTIRLGLTYCFVLAFAFVGSLYVLVPPKIRQLPRDDARQIKWRAAATFVVCTWSCFLRYCLICSNRDALSMTSSFLTKRFVLQQLINVAVVLAHTASLYLVSFVHMTFQAYDFVWQRDGKMAMKEVGRVFYAAFISPTLSSIMRPIDRSARWITLRNIVFAPIAEEIVFRACMIPILENSGLTMRQSIFMAPLFFGVAHGHHALQRLKMGGEPGSVLIETLLQFTYTSLFGFYVSYVYSRCRCLMAVVVSHMLCNIMGLPDLSFFRRSSSLYRYRVVLIATLLAGIITFLLGLVWLDFPATE